MDLWQLLITGGSTTALTVMLYGFYKGWWRTSQEVDVWKMYAENEHAGRLRAEAREEEVEKSLRMLTEAVEAVLDGKPR